MKEIQEITNQIWRLCTTPKRISTTKMQNRMHMSNRIMMNGQKNVSGKKRFNILQNIQDRTNLEGQLKRARDQVTKHTECLEPNETGGKRSMSDQTY